MTGTELTLQKLPKSVVLALHVLAVGPLKFSAQELRLLLLVLSVGPLSARAAANLLRRDWSATKRTARDLLDCRILIREEPEGRLAFNTRVDEWRHPSGLDGAHRGERLDLRTVASAQVIGAVTQRPQSNSDLGRATTP